MINFDKSGDPFRKTTVLHHLFDRIENKGKVDGERNGNLSTPEMI